MLDRNVGTSQLLNITEMAACAFLRLGSCFTILICTVLTWRPIQKLRPVCVGMLLRDKLSRRQGCLQGWPHLHENAFLLAPSTLPQHYRHVNGKIGCGALPEYVSSLESLSSCLALCTSKITSTDLRCERNSEGLIKPFVATPRAAQLGILGSCAESVGPC